MKGIGFLSRSSRKWKPFRWEQEEEDDDDDDEQAKEEDEGK